MTLQDIKARMVQASASDMLTESSARIRVTSDLRNYVGSYWGYIGVRLGLHWDNGKYNGNC